MPSSFKTNINQGDMPRQHPPQNGQAARILLHPDYTVGPGVSPDLLTPTEEGRSRAIPPVGNCTPP